MQPLGLKDQDIFYKYLRASDSELSAVSFVNIFIWEDFFKFTWEIIEDNFCLFAENQIGCFLYLPPLGKRVSKPAVQRCFEIMDSRNLDINISRIENAEWSSREFYHSLGLRTVIKEEDYLYRRKDLATLRGNAYKPKRAAVKHFIKNYSFRYLPFKKSDTPECLGLYREWQEGRKGTNCDRIYQQMLEDNFLVQKRAMENFQRLNLVGRTVKIDGKVRAYSFGFKLKADTFCILAEIADLRIKGLANFLFNEFCREMEDYEYINCMGACGLENIKRTKISFRPHRLIPAYIVRRD